MFWINVGLGAIAGVLSGLIARIIVGKPREKTAAYTAVVAVVFAVLFLLGRQYIEPEITARYEAYRAESVLLKIPVYDTIKEHYPATFQQILAELKQAIIRKEDRTELVARLRSRMSAFAFQCFPRASDEAVKSFIESMLVQIEQLSKKDPDLCYAFLFPEDGKNILFMQHISEETQRVSLQAFAAVVRTSAENPQKIPDESDILEDLQTVYLEIYDIYGDNIQFLENPSDSSVNKLTVCSMTADLYKRILELPLKRSSQLLRYLFNE